MIVQIEKKQVSVEKRLIDHRLCGGGGCKTCRQMGTQFRSVQIPNLGPMPSDEDSFESERERCPCYEGISINAGVSQCTHADHREDGEWCEVISCPRVVDKNDL